MQHFIAQTYDHKNLIVLDDDDCPAFPDGIDLRSVRYSRLKITYHIPEKLNMACEIAKDADIIAKFDSDDFYSPDRMAFQVRRLEETGKAVTVYREILFHDVNTNEAYKYRINSKWGTGTSLTFLRSFWMQNRFNEKYFTGSDNRFIKAAFDAKQLDSIPDEHKHIVARIHDGNTSHKRQIKKHRAEDSNYYPVPLSELPAEYLALESLELAKA